MRVVKPFNFLVAGLAIGTTFYGFLAHLPFDDPFELKFEVILILIFITLGVMVLLVTMNKIFTDLEDLIIKTFSQRF